MSPRIHIVERVENNVEALEPCDIEAILLDVLMVCLDLDIGVEATSGLFRNLKRVSACALIPALY